MASYTLQPNEALLLKEDGVAHGGAFASHTDELILTTVHLVLVKKGMFGKTKQVLTFPLSQVKVHDHQAQALVTTGGNGTPALEVYFLHGQEQFRFASGGKRKALTWAAKVNETITGQKSAAGAGVALPGAEFVSQALRGTFDVFKGALGAPAQAQAAATVGGKCTSCGAPVSGLRGSAAACDYCGNLQAV